MDRGGITAGPEQRPAGSGFHVGPFRVALKRGDDVAALRLDLEPGFARVGDEGFDQPRRNAASADRGRDKRMVGNMDAIPRDPGEAANDVAVGDMRLVFSGPATVVLGDGHAHHACAPVQFGA